MLRSLVGVKTAFSPQISGHSVYYGTVGPGKNCSAIMRVPYRGGRPVAVHQFGGAVEQAFAVSRDGRMLAYAWSPQADAAPGGTCSATSARFLTVVNLATGQRHTISHLASTIFGLGWSLNDRHLLTGQDNAEAEVLPDLFSNAAYHPGQPLPCPE